MRMRIWRGSKLVHAFDCDGPGPSIDVDPWADLINTDELMPMPYSVEGIGRHLKVVSDVQPQAEGCPG